MQRLEIMQQLALQAKAEAAGQPRKSAPSLPAVRRLPRRRAQIIVLAWFSLGVLASGGAGFGTLVGLRALDARGTPLTWASIRASLGSALASAWANMPPVASKARPAPDGGGQWQRAEVRIDGGKRAPAPLGLHVTGGDGRPVFFVLEGLPKGVRPSHGAAVGPGTWVVPGADIASLHVVMDEGAPGAFDMRISLLAPTGVAKSGSIVQVRLVDGAAPRQAGAAGPTSVGPAALASATQKGE